MHFALSTVTRLLSSAIGPPSTQPPGFASLPRMVWQLARTWDRARQQKMTKDGPWDEGYLVALEEMVCDLEASFGT